MAAEFCDSETKVRADPSDALRASSMLPASRPRLSALPPPRSICGALRRRFRYTPACCSLPGACMCTPPSESYGRRRSYDGTTWRGRRYGPARAKQHAARDMVARTMRPPQNYRCRIMARAWLTVVFN
eukprot:4573547-Pleurochrysis_carterae.AAC.3